MSCNSIAGRLSRLLAVWLLIVGVPTIEASDRIPKRAHDYKRTIQNEYRRAFGLNMPADASAIGAGTIHQESAWNPRAQSSHAKGLTQFTNPSWDWIQQIDRSITDLGDVWSPRASIRAMAVFHAFLWVRVPKASNEQDRWAFVLSSYNGGAGNLSNDIALCKLVVGCDRTRWWGNVELHSTRAPAAFRENRSYSKQIWFQWRPTYAAAGF